MQSLPHYSIPFFQVDLVSANKKLRIPQRCQIFFFPFLLHFREVDFLRIQSNLSQHRTVKMFFFGKKHSTPYTVFNSARVAHLAECKAHSSQNCFFSRGYVPITQVRRARSSDSEEKGKTCGDQRHRNEDLHFGPLAFQDVQASVQQKWFHDAVDIMKVLSWASFPVLTCMIKFHMFAGSSIHVIKKTEAAMDIEMLWTCAQSCRHAVQEASGRLRGNIGASGNECGILYWQLKKRAELLPAARVSARLYNRRAANRRLLALVTPSRKNALLTATVEGALQCRLLLDVIEKFRILHNLC